MEKVVMRVAFENDKSRKKALILAVSTTGVESAGIVGPHRNGVEVVGVGIDWGRMMVRMSKKIGPTKFAGFQEIEGGGGGGGGRDCDGEGSSRGRGGGGGGGCGHGGGDCVIL